MARLETIARDTPGVEHTVGISGQSLLMSANAPNLGSMYVMLKEFRDRRGITADDDRRAHPRQCQAEIRDAPCRVVRCAADRRAGHDRRLQDDHRRSRQPGPDRAASGQRSDRRQGNDTPGLDGLFTSTRANTPWLYLDIDRTKCLAVGLSMAEVFNTLQVYLGSYYVNNFNEFGRTWQVNVMADPRFRDRIDDIAQIQAAQQTRRDGAAGYRARRRAIPAGRPW